MYYIGEVIKVTAKQLIEMSLGYAGLSQRQLADNLGCTPQTLNNRIKTGRFTLEEWQQIAQAMGATLDIHMVFPDGKRV